MTTSRKIQTEIDRTLKKVHEGVEIFDALWERVHEATTQAHKERQEGELKKEIKKLQRLREQIKAWQLSAEIKDKKPIGDARRLIELKMEAFKVCERETKTKAYSKEGLALGGSRDPAEAARAHTTAWINQCIQSLGDRIAELELDAEAAAGRKKRAGKPEVAPEAQMERSKWHTLKLELILRLIDNGEVHPADVDDIRDDVEEFVESRGSMERAEEECLYDMLDLPSIESLGLSPMASSLSRKENQPDAQSRPKPAKDEKKKEVAVKKEVTAPKHTAEATPPVQPALVKTLASVKPASETAQPKQQPGKDTPLKDFSMKLMEMSFQNLPHSGACEFQGLFTPKNPARTPPSFPQRPLPSLNSYATFEHLALDTLLFIFYYEPGAYRQTLAVAELKRRGWALEAQSKRWSNAEATWDWEGTWGLRQC